jgi:2-polyprenyl-3-methyl-5-hydroxy-6-metoxy-1,4-benzoquinol methylase
MKCPLCGTAGSKLFLEEKHRSYYHCNSCDIIFVPEKYHLSPDGEAQRYALHDNSIDNAEYVKYLSEIVPVIKNLKTRGLRVLDFGCGIKAVLGKLFQIEGINCDSYDPLYSLGTECAAKHYDVLVLNEVVEHLRNPVGEIEMMKRMLGRDGKLILRTSIYPSKEGFHAWWYKEDMTHINFFSLESLSVFARKLGLRRVERVTNNIFILQR